MHLYLHVPFCARRCSYCDFAIAVRREVPSGQYLEAVRTEWRGWAGAPWWESTGPIETIYFGGGTPSLLDPGVIRGLIAMVRADRAVAAGVEVTLEANPEDVDRARAEAWVEAGVNRVSLGVQSFDPAVLGWMHRIHDADRPAAAVGALRAAGIANLSVDLIYAVPGALGRDWGRDLERAVALGPDHVSMYGLTVEDRTPLGRWVGRGEAVPAPESRAAEEYLAAHRRLGEAGLGFYEVSNAARPGFESRHNLAYWRRAPYLGLGPSAHSAVGAHRWWNRRDWAAYERAVAAALAGGAAAAPGATDLVAGEERLDPAQVHLEELYLGLRTRTGVAASMLPGNIISAWITAGWAHRVGDRVALTPEGWLRLDALVTQAAGA